MENIIIKIKRALGIYNEIEELKKKGLVIGDNFSMQDQCIIDGSHAWLIKIGSNVTLAPRTYILAHDASTKRELGYAKIGKVTIGDNVFVGASSMILPGVTIGSNVIIGAGSVVSKNIPDNSVAIGSPAKVIKSYDSYIDFNKNKLKESPKYDYSYTLGGGITEQKKEKMQKDLEGIIGYVE